MTVFLTTLIALWANPIISYFIVYYTKSKIQISKKLFILSIFIISMVVICLLTNISTTVIEVDFFILAIFHFFICILLWQGYYYKNEIVSSFAILFLIIAFEIGYYYSTVGIIATLFVVKEFEPSKEIRINKSTVYKEYNFGNALTSREGTKLSLFTNYYWFPFFEREFFSKQYIGTGAFQNSIINDSNIINPNKDIIK